MGYDESAFEERLREFGLDPSDALDTVPPDGYDKPFVLSGDPAESFLPSQHFTIRNVDEAKRLGGNSDGDYESGAMEEHHVIPRPWPEERNDVVDDDLSPDERAGIRQAHLAYIYGYSPRVASYRDVINKLYYPMDATAVTAGVLNVTTAITLKNEAYVFGNVTIYKNGSITFGDPAGSFTVTGTLSRSDATGPTK